VGDAAAELGIAPILTPERLRAPAVIADVLALDLELIVLADYGQIVPGTLLKLPFGALNLHPSALPRHRGASPIPATILAGDQQTAVALMRMDAGLDTGPLVAVEPVRMAGDETAPVLEQRLAQVGAHLLLRSLGPWLRGELPARPQEADGASLTKPLRRADGRLDAAVAAETLERQVRAFQPWPGSWFEAGDQRVTVWASRVLPGRADEPGVLVPAGDGLGLVTSDGVLELVDVQPAGGRRMSGAELVRGRPGLLGRVIEGPARGAMG
jgi:methionyl-tRNA formyltransferase